MIFAITLMDFAAFSQAYSTWLLKLSRSSMITPRYFSSRFALACSPTVISVRCTVLQLLTNSISVLWCAICRFAPCIYLSIVTITSLANISTSSVSPVTVKTTSSAKPTISTPLGSTPLCIQFQSVGPRMERPLPLVRIVQQDPILEVAPKDPTQVIGDPHYMQGLGDGFPAGAVERVLHIDCHHGAIAIRFYLDALSAFSITKRMWTGSIGKDPSARKGQVI